MSDLSEPIKIHILSIQLLLVIMFSVASQLVQASDVSKGREIYQRHCIMCHGDNGKSTMAGAADFNRGQGLFKSDHALLERIKKGEKACPAYFGILKEQQIFDVIAYIRTLYR